MGTLELGIGNERFFPCPMPHAQCPMPHAPYPTIHYRLTDREGIATATGSDRSLIMKTKTTAHEIL
jgi:hypothetical protein